MFQPSFVCTVRSGWVETSRGFLSVLCLYRTTAESIEHSGRKTLHLQLLNLLGLQGTVRSMFRLGQERDCEELVGIYAGK